MSEKVAKGKALTVVKSAATSVDPKAQESRRILLTTAARLFAERGFAGVSTRDIAKDAKLNISLISYYFDGKEGLYRAIIEDFIDQNKAEYIMLVENFDVAAMTTMSFSNHMKILIGRILQRKFENPYLSPLLFRELMSQGQIAIDSMETKMATMADGIIQIFKEAQAKGILKPDLHVATLFFSMVQSMDSYLLTAKKFAPLRDRCFDLPRENQLYIDQIHKIFIEGALK